MFILYRKVGEDNQQLRFRLDKRRMVIGTGLTLALIIVWAGLLWSCRADRFEVPRWCDSGAYFLIFSSGLAVLFSLSYWFFEDLMREMWRARRQKKKVVVADLGNLFWGPIEFWIEK